MKVRIVLVEPHEAGNVGAAARAMKNFGFDDLVIVGPRDQREDRISDWWASGAEDLVRSARRVSSLENALTDCHLSIATTAVRGRQVFEQLTPRGVADLASASLGEAHTLAIVFGREEWGLTQREVAICQRTASIPTSPAFPTMNLAQSVALFCYELSGALRPAAGTPEPAPGHLLHLLHRHGREVLLEVGFLHHQNPDRIYDELRSLAGRALLTTRETSVLLALIREIERRLGIKVEDKQGDRTETAGRG